MIVVETMKKTLTKMLSDKLGRRVNCLILGAFLVTLLGSPAFAGTPAAKPAGRTLDFHLVDKLDGKPLAGASLCVNYVGGSTWTLTGPDGVSKINLIPSEPKYFGVTAYATSHVITEVSWRNDKEPDPVPAQYTLKLERGTVIGGFIKDEQDRPIAGADVFLLVPSDAKPGEHERVAIRDFSVKTDASGQWRCDSMPAKLDDVLIRLAHPDYASDNMYGATPKPSMEQLRAQTGVMVMKRGLRVAGTVADESGKPIKGAQVVQGNDRFGTEFPRLQTDAEGHFAFNQCKPGEMILTVSAPGHAPELKKVAVAPALKPVNFRLGKGHVIRGRIVDQAGQPVAGAFVAADTWRGCRSIEWRVDTDAQGRFSWDSAPADAVLFDMGKQDCMSIRRQPLTARDKEYVLTMKKPLTVSGKVTDAETHKPIAVFNVVQGMDWGNGQPVYWEARHSKPGKDGAYRFTFHEPCQAHLVRIEAEGYLPASSGGFKDDAGDQTFDCALEKGTGPAGVVLGANGKPLAEADVSLYTAANSVFVQNGEISRRQDGAVLVTTGPDGRFVLPPQTDPYGVIVLHKQGYATLTQEELAKDSRIKLKPWGRIEGHLMIGSKPGAQEKVIFFFEEVGGWDPKKPRVNFNFETQTDNQGNFVFERVLAGPARLFHGIKIGEHQTAYSLGLPVELKPGETIHPILGGTGRPVIGRLAAPAGQVLNWNNVEYSSIRRKSPEPPLPKELKAKGPEAREEIMAWYKKWQQSDAYKAQRKAERNYALKVEPDGSFRIDDVEAGDYILSLRVGEPLPDRQSGMSQPVAQLAHEFKVPPMFAGRSEKPLDLGKLEVKMVKHLKVGDEAPPFKVKTVDGKPLRLADFRGKYVLLDFWATWCGPCVAEMPHLKKVYETYGKDKHFAMVSLSVDTESEAPRKFAASQGIKWIQGFLGEWKKSTVPDEYGVQGIPAIFLIDPQGKIVGLGLRGDAVGEAVRQALAAAAGDDKPEKP